MPDLGRFRIGDWIVNQPEGTLSDGGRVVRLEPRVMDLLVYLAARPGEVVCKEEILRAVWKGCFVEDGVLSQAVHNLRRALADDPRQPQYIQTIPKRGYRFLAAIAAVEPPAPPETIDGQESSPAPVGSPPTQAESPPVRTGQGRLFLAIFGGAAAFLSWLVLHRRGATAPPRPRSARENRALVDRAIGFVSHRNNLSGSEAEDFRRSVLEKLMEDDDEVFRGGGMLEAYLAIFVQQQLGDWLRQKWEASAVARQCGVEAAKVDELIGFFCRRYHLSEPEAEDFQRSVYAKLMEDDFRVFRTFRGNISAKTYLLAMVQRHLFDWRKQRPSTEAQRLTRVAVEFEVLMRHDGLTADEACETLLTNHHGEVSRAELERIASLLPPRQKRHMVDHEVLNKLPAADERPEGPILESEFRSVHRLMLPALDKALGELPADDRLVFEMCALRGQTITEATRFLSLPRKPRQQLILACLRRALEAQGFSWEQVSESLGMSEVRWE